MCWKFAGIKKKIVRNQFIKIVFSSEQDIHGLQLTQYNVGQILLKTQQKSTFKIPFNLLELNYILSVHYLKTVFM